MITMKNGALAEPYQVRGVYRDTAQNRKLHRVGDAYSKTMYRIVKGAKKQTGKGAQDFINKAKEIPVIGEYLIKPLLNKIGPKKLQYSNAELELPTTFSTADAMRLRKKYGPDWIEHVTAQDITPILHATEWEEVPMFEGQGKKRRKQKGRGLSNTARIYWDEDNGAEMVEYKYDGEKFSLPRNYVESKVGSVADMNNRYNIEDLLE